MPIGTPSPVQRPSDGDGMKCSTHRCQSLDRGSDGALAGRTWSSSHAVNVIGAALGWWPMIRSVGSNRREIGKGSDHKRDKRGPKNKKWDI